MIIKELTDFLFPKYCVGCEKYGEDLCKKCLREMPIAEQICPECGRDCPMGWTHPGCVKKSGMDGLIVIYDYQDLVIKEVIKEIKFGFNRDLIRRILKNFKFETGEKFDYLVPVPLYFYRENWRGFNQAEEIAKVIGEKMKAEVFKALKRKRKTKQQSLILDREEREKKCKGSF